MADPYVEWLDEDAARLDALASLAKEKGYTVKLFKGNKKKDGEGKPSGRSLWQSQVHFAGWAEARSLTISIDFDRTFAADPRLWGEFARGASEDGNTVVMITRREDTEENRGEIEDTIGGYADAFDSVILAGPEMQKEVAAKEAGLKVDIWVDDSPQTIKSRAFCPTGPGGGVDNSCSSKAGSGYGSIPLADDLEKVKNLGGSTGAMLAKGADGKLYVVKKGNSPEHIRAEAATNDIYRAAGVPVPRTRLDTTDPDEPKQIAEYAENARPLGSVRGAEREAAIAEIQKGFVIDALVANWDVVGLEEDNILVPKSGPPLRVDNGGSLQFRAQGAEKNFGPVVGELKTLRESEQGEPIFGSLEDSHVVEQIREVLVRREAILGATPSELRETMNERLRYIEEWARTREEREERAFCPTGPGGGVDNSCSSKDGGGGGGSESTGGGKEKQGEFGFAKEYAGKKLITSHTASPFTKNDAAVAASITNTKTKDGREIPVVDRSDAVQMQYLEEIEEDGTERGFITDFDTAKEVGQEDTSITISEEEYGPYAAFVGEAYGVLNGQDDVSSAEDTIDLHGVEYGTFDEDMMTQMIDDRLDEQWSEISKDPEDLANELGRDDVEVFKQELESGAMSMADIEDEWKTNNRDAAYEVVEDQRNEARVAAVDSMRSDLESSLASTSLNCCLQLYRGMTLGDMAIKQAIESGFIVHDGANSWTTSTGTARSFGASSVLLVCRNPRVGHIYQADAAREREVTRPPSRMRIIGVVKTKTGTVMYVDEDDDYKTPGWDDTVRETVAAAATNNDAEEE